MAGAGGGSDPLPVGITSHPNPLSPSLNPFPVSWTALLSGNVVPREQLRRAQHRSQAGMERCWLGNSKAMGWQEQGGKGRIFVLVSNGMSLSTLGGNYPRCTNYPS